MFNLKLPDFEIIAWIESNDFGKALANDMLSITQNLEIYEDGETEDKLYYHWIVPSWVETLVIGGKLKEFEDNPNLIFLKLKANYDSSIQDVTLKDLRKFKRVP